MLKRVVNAVGFGLVILAVALVLIAVRDCQTRPPQPPHGASIPEDTYREPIINVPFIKGKSQPISTERLPIPKEQVSQSIVITPAESGSAVELIIDKGGKVYLPVDDTATEVKVTAWKPRLVSLSFRFGASEVYSAGRWYTCLSTDFLRVSKFHLGSEIGATNRGDKVLVGLSVKYDFGTLQVAVLKNIRLRLVGGWNFIGNSAYIGGGFQW